MSQALLEELTQLSRQELLQIERETRPDALQTEEKFDLYEPSSEVMMKFHTSKARVRALIAGNRSGKTTALSIEANIKATSRVPASLRKLYPKHRLRAGASPIIRLCAVDYDNGVAKIVRPAVLKWAPHDSLIPGAEVTNKGTQINYRNGAVIEMMSYAQPPIKFGGTARDLIGYDEPPPPDVVKENELRTVDYGGDEIYAFTPVVHSRDDASGNTSSNAKAIGHFYNHIYQRAGRIVRPGSDVSNPNGESWIEVFHTDSFSNPHIDPEILYQIIAGLTESEKKARIDGEFQHLAGLIYGAHYREDRHCLDSEKFEYDTDWPVYVAIDTHPKIPHHVTYMWVNPHHQMVVCDELSIYGTADDLVGAMFELEKSRNYWVVWRLIDPMANAPDMETKVSFSHELAKRGAVCRPGSKEPLTGIYATRAAFDNSELFFLDRCRGHLWEIMQYIWKGDKPLKENDHYMENLRRLVLSNPPHATKQEIKAMMSTDGDLNY